jgi:hypothetical protein
MTKPLLVGLSERYGYDALGFIVAPPGKTITTAPPIRLDEADKEHVERLRRLLIERLFYLNRWGGEPTLYGCQLSVGIHSIIVAMLAGMRARRSGWVQQKQIGEYEATGAIHDIGEALGLGDVPGPLLDAHPAIEAVRQEHQRMASALFPAGLRKFAVVNETIGNIDRGVRIWERHWFYPESYQLPYTPADGAAVALRDFGEVIRALPVKDWIEGRRIDEAVDLLLSLAMGNGAVLTAGGSIVASQPIAVVVGDVTTRPTVTFEEARRRLVQEHGVGVQVGITAGGSIESAQPAPNHARRGGVQVGITLEEEGSLLAYDKFMGAFDFESCELEEVIGGVRWRVKGIPRDLDTPAMLSGPADVVITLYRTGKATTGGKETPQRAAVRRWLEEQGFNVSC